MWYKHYNKTENEDHIFDAIIALEAHGESSQPPSATEWMETNSIVFPQVVLSDGRSAIHQFLKESRAGVQPCLRPFFARRGWYESTVEWIKTQLSTNDFPPVKSVTQISCTYRGTTLRVEMSDGTCAYLKCSHFVNEPSVCNVLADISPRLVAKPIATDEELRLLLMRDYGEITSPFEFDDSETAQWIQELTAFHRATMSKKDRLRDAGLRVAPLETMTEEFEKALYYAHRLQLLDDTLMQELAEWSNVIRLECQDVMLLDIPPSFVHGDLFFSNVYRTTGSDASHGIMDFGESIISHPFIDSLACREPKAHSKAWLEFLKKKFPDRADIDLEKRIFRCKCLFTRLRPFCELMRLYYEFDLVESPIPPDMLLTFKGEILCLLRGYKRDHGWSRRHQPAWSEEGQLHTLAEVARLADKIYQDDSGPTHSPEEG